MNLIEYRDAVVEYLAANLKSDIREVRPFPARFDLESVQRSVIQAPSLLISFLGVPQMGLSNIARFEANVSMAAYIVTKEEPLRQPNDMAILLANDVADFLSMRTWGLSNVQPALVTRIDNLHTIDMARAGISICAVAWSQNVTLGRDVYHEDEFSQPVPENFDVRTLDHWPEDLEVNATGQMGSITMGPEDA